MIQKRYPSKHSRKARIEKTARLASEATMDIVLGSDENVMPVHGEHERAVKGLGGKAGGAEAVKRTPLSSRNVNTPSAGGHIARTNAKGDIVIYSPAYIITKDNASASKVGGATPIILEDVVSADDDVPVARLNFGQFKKRDLSTLGLHLSPLVHNKANEDGTHAPHTTPADAGNPASPMLANVGEGEMLIGRHLLLTAITPSGPPASSQSRFVMTDPRPKAVSIGDLTTLASIEQRGRAATTMESPVHFSSQGLTPLVGSPQAEMQLRFEVLEDKLAAQEKQMAQERSSMQQMIDQLSKQVELLLSSRQSEQ
eukprot:g21529.t1